MNSNNLAYQFDEIYDELIDGKIASIATEFKCSLYDDLYIKLDDVFEDLF